MAAGVTKRLWEMSDVVDVLEAWEANSEPKQIGLSASDEPSTGAHVSSVVGAVPVTAVTLDSLFGSITPDDRTLIKLDLQGYELNALRGGTALLRSAEAILAEVSFFAQAYEPSITELLHS
jgi:FkbM family methyltransferase